MKAVYVSKEGRELQDRPIPSPDQHEVLIRNVAVSSNPKDWKIPFYMAPYAAVEGNDVAGYVEKVGEGVPKFKVGDKVAAFTKMRTDDKYGAYAEYSVSPSNTAFHLGPNTSFEDAAALPLAYSTAAIGLFKRLGLSEPDQPGQRDGALLVWGGATTVGVYAIQLAKKAGYHVVAIAGSSQDVPKSYGADEVLDYRNKSTSSLAFEIRQSYGGKGVKYIYDAVSEGTLEVVAEALKDVEGAKYTYVLTYTEEQLKTLPSNVHPERTLCATAYGEDSDFAEKWFDWVGKAIEAGGFRAQKVTVVPGGLEGVKEGLRRLQQGEVRGEKLVYRIKETPRLA
ncbi:zinc-binding oxidoreductase [Rhodotorula toruloides]|uniref:BY PROTMAP: gi/472582556/gb/EMS20234.1/ zinc-binding oxidoreductase [Rhodosporidium toruloides NP11] gi/647399124/emb/CDR43607.1/ RHTO0S08e03422g1_1 [Rhodosporidium toruloides] n=1 Tax=Rhodotorula toruloides TaxID=5286 RepID=A0A0K3CEK0_RHOTO|nr:zinc-binding oxidoreductase [Rhodotorula toruloides]PRQ75177.1 GroES-like protein [Rhodotorula toruloides]